MNPKWSQTGAGIGSNDMLNDVKLAQLIDSRQQSITAMMQGYFDRIHGCDKVQVDEPNKVISFFDGPNVRWKASVELIGVFMMDIDRWRWWWVLPHSTPSAGSRLDKAFSTGMALGIDSLTTPNPRIATENDANLMARLCAFLSEASGMHTMRQADRLSFFAVFSEPGAIPRKASDPLHYHSMLPPPSTIPTRSIPQPQPMGSSHSPLMSLYPGAPTESRTPAPTSRSIRLPARQLVRPVAQYAHDLVSKHMPQGFHQAVLVVYVDMRDNKLRFSTLLVASNSTGNITVFDPSTEMMKAIHTLLSEDALSGNGRWSRLTLHLTPVETGTSLEVHVKA